MPEDEVQKNSPETSNSEEYERGYADALNQGKQDATPKGVEQTKSGLMAFAIGMALLWVPYIKYVGYLVCLAGVIYLVLGRTPFGEKHGIYVGASIVLYVITSVTALSVAVSMGTAILNSPLNAGTISNIFKEYFIALLAIGSVTTISYLLLVWNISTDSAKWLLLVAFVATIVIEFVTYMLVMPTVDSAITTVISTHNTSILNNEIGYINTLKLLNAVPYILFVLAYWLVYKGIDSGKIGPASRSDEFS